MDAQKMVLNRTVGIELEGYLEKLPTEVTVHNSDIGQDGSLRGKAWRMEDDDDYYWDEDSEEGQDNGYAVEIRTKPFTDLHDIFAIFRDMTEAGWHVDHRAGTHIHVDINDFTGTEQAKLLRFVKGIERIMYMLVEDYRNGNTYCAKVHKDWRKVFWARSVKYKDINWNEVNEQGLEEYISRKYGYAYGDTAIWNGKYQWLNVLDSRFGTAEFRIFHAARSAEELIAQAQLAYSIVELVKNTDIEQLQFIIKSIHAQESVEAMIHKLFEVLGLSFVMEAKGTRAIERMERKLRGELEQGEETQEVSV